MIDKHICLVKGWKFDSHDDLSDKNLVEMSNILLDMGMHSDLDRFIVTDTMFSNYLYFGAVAIDENISWGDWTDTVLVDESVGAAWKEFEQWKSDNPEKWSKLQPHCSDEPETYLFMKFC